MPKTHAKYVVTSRLNMMIRDLEQMRKVLLPASGGDPLLSDVELQQLDAFERIKVNFTAKVTYAKEKIQELTDYRAKRNHNARRAVEIQHQNYLLLNELKDIWTEMNIVLQKQLVKRKLSEDVAKTRTEMMSLFGLELVNLEKINTNIQPVHTEVQLTNKMNRNAELRRERHRQRVEMRNQKLKLAGSSTSDVTIDINDNTCRVGNEQSIPSLTSQPTIALEPPVIPVSENERQFMAEIVEVDQQVDGMLDTISKGLGELGEIGKSIGIMLDEQNVKLEQVEEKMDKTNTNYVTANARLKKFIAKTTGGATTWCPIFVTLVVLLALIGYIVNLAR